MKRLLYLGLGILACACQPMTSPDSPSASMEFISPFSSAFRFMGIMDRSDSAGVRFSWTGSQIHFGVKGVDSLEILLGHTPLAYDPDSLPWPIYFSLIIDGEVRDRIRIVPDSETYTLRGLDQAAHEIELFRESEASSGITTFQGLNLPVGGEILPASPMPDRHLAFYGNSLTCGYGNLGADQNCNFHTDTENGYLAYGAIAARKLEAAYSTVCYSGKGIWQNYDSTLTETLFDLYNRFWPGPDKRTQPVGASAPSAIVINLGTNDFAHRIPPREAFVGRYVQFVELLHDAYPDAPFFLLLGCSITDSPTRQRRTALNSYLDEIAQACQSEGMIVHRFDHTPHGPLGYGCDWHPNLAQQQLNGDETAAFIAEKMGW